MQHGKRCITHRVPKKNPSCARSHDVEDTTSSMAPANIGRSPERASPILIVTPVRCTRMDQWVEFEGWQHAPPNRSMYGIKPAP